MALDIRPLSPGRHWLMVGIMAVLFLASLGFAELLVVERRQEVVVTAYLPAAFHTVIHDYDSVPGLVMAREARTGGVERRVALFAFESEAEGSAELRDVAADLFVALYKDSPEAFETASLDGRPAAEAVGRFGDNSAAWVRVARAGDKAVAFCYSGADAQPDQDSITFNDLATRAVRITVIGRHLSPRNEAGMSPIRTLSPTLPLALALALALTLAAGFVQRTAAAADPSGLTAIDPAQDDAMMLLGPLYKDERAGIKIAPPVGCRMIARAGLELVSFVQDQKQWGGSVQRIILKEPADVAPYLQMTAADLSKSFRAVQILESKPTTFEGKPAGRLTASMEGEGAGPRPGAPQVPIAILRQQLLVKTGAQEYVVLTLFSPLRDKPAAIRTFEAMIGSFEILDPTQVLARRAKAVALGKAWLADRSADELRAKMLPQPQLFRTRIAGQDYGYVQFTEYETPPNSQKSSVDGLYGFFISIDSRSFPPNDPKILSIFGHNMAFWAYKCDHSGGSEQPFHSVWDNLSTTNTVNPRDPATGLSFWLREAGVLDMDGDEISAADRAKLRQQRAALVAKGVPASQLPPPVPEPRFHMHVTWRGDPTQTLTEENSSLDMAIPAEAPAALPKVLEYTWTRVVDLTKPSEMSFVVYNSTTRKLALRTLSVIGNERIIINGRATDAIKCVDELDPGSTLLWVDSTGKILMMRTSDQTLLTPTTTQEMQAMWRNRLK